MSSRPITPPADPPPVALASLPRGPGEAIKATLESYSGSPFVRLAVWRRAETGQWWREKTLTIRQRELGAIVEALAEAVLRIEAADGSPVPTSVPVRPEPRQRPDRRRSRARSIEPRATLPLGPPDVPAAPPFDEFD